jgi:hypothetical protein
MGKQAGRQRPGALRIPTEYHHLISRRQQFRRQRPANEAGASCDERPLHLPSSVDTSEGTGIRKECKSK